MIINVTQTHINSGRKVACRECPVALAINEVIKPDLKASVGNPTLTILDKDNLIVFGGQVPDNARRFIMWFDTPYPNEIAKPFSFELDLPEHILL